MHALAIPLLPIAGVLAVVQCVDGVWALWWRPTGLLIVSYAFQWAGHRIEGNDMGEVILLKKLLGRPFVDIAPRYRAADQACTDSAGEAQKS